MLFVISSERSLFTVVHVCKRVKSYHISSIYYSDKYVLDNFYIYDINLTPALLIDNNQFSYATKSMY